MKIATWNVNSIRAREQRLVNWLRTHAPDVLCLQELKVDDAHFPAEVIAAAGYQAAVFGQKTYNGVAILSREAATDVVRGFGDGVDDPAARFIAATVAGVRIASVYVPNGQSVGSDKFRYKLQWLARWRDWLDGHADASRPLAMCGDFNVAPEDRDVHDPIEWRDQVLCHPDERAGLARVAAFGLQDVFRRFHSDGGLYSWWDYRQLGFPMNRGLRIDHILCTPSLADRATAATIDRNERKGGKTNPPSDHAPVVVEFS